MAYSKLEISQREFRQSANVPNGLKFDIILVKFVAKSSHHCPIRDNKDTKSQSFYSSFLRVSVAPWFKRACNLQLIKTKLAKFASSRCSRSNSNSLHFSYAHHNFIDTSCNWSKILPNMYSAIALHHHVHHSNSQQDRDPVRASLN